MENEIFKTIGNITRVKILACLGRSDKSVTELIGNCDLSQSAVSQHLAYLREVGLITSVRNGKYQIYKVADPRISKICDEILDLLPNIKKFN